MYLLPAPRLDPADSFAAYQLAMALNAAGRDEESRGMVRKLRQLRDEERRAGEAKQKLRLVKEAPREVKGPQ